MEFFSIKFWGGLGLTVLAWLFTFISPVTPFIICVGLFVFADLYTGLKAAKKRNEEIRSKGLRRTIGKITQYSLAIILSHVLTVVFLPSVPIAVVTSFYIALVEFKSNIENISYLTGLDIWRALVERLPTFGKGNLSKSQIEEITKKKKIPNPEGKKTPPQATNPEGFKEEPLFPEHIKKKND